MNELLFNAAVAEFESGHFASCANLCKTALGKDPAAENILTLLAMALHAAGDLEGAANAFAELTRIRPDVGEYHANVGLMLRHLGRHEEAEAMDRSQ